MYAIDQLLLPFADLKIGKRIGGGSVASTEARSVPSKKSMLLVWKLSMLKKSSNHFRKRIKVKT